jgi:hypothetical protein
MQSAPTESEVGNELVQPFPISGPLADNLNTPLPVIARQLRDSQARAYSYVVRTVKLNAATQQFEQRGSAPNFQGGVLSLCTCKHRMRACRSSAEWENDVWLVGFSSRTMLDGKHWLFYLAKIESAIDSHSDVWAELSSRARKAKEASQNYLGDVFEPKTPAPIADSRFLPSRYVAPSRHAHRKTPGDSQWKNDICYKHADKYRHPSLLLADPRQTFLWEQPTIYLTRQHCRDYLKQWPLNTPTARVDCSRPFGRHSPRQHLLRRPARIGR